MKDEVVDNKSKLMNDYDTLPENSHLAHVAEGLP